MPQCNPLPPIEVLNNLLNYDPTTGDITWRVNRGRTAKAGDIAGITNKAGYRLIAMRRDGKQHNYLAHRLAWALYYGEDPYPMEIDHKNRNPGDNSISNLRLATRSQQNYNMSSTGVSGVRGVTWHCGGWRVLLSRRYKGWTKDLNEAKAMREQAEKSFEL